MSSSTKSRRAGRRTPLEVELRLGEFVAKGATAAEVSGHAVGIDRGIPGELVQASVDRRRRVWRGVVDAVLERSPDCTVVQTSNGPGLQIVIQGIEGLTLDSHPELPDVAATVAACDSVATVSFRHRTGVVWALIGELESPIEVAGKLMWLPAGAFVQ